jgi:hypothetical protein
MPCQSPARPASPCVHVARVTQRVRTSLLLGEPSRGTSQGRKFRGGGILRDLLAPRGASGTPDDGESASRRPNKIGGGAGDSAIKLVSKNARIRSNKSTRFPGVLCVHKYLSVRCRFGERRPPADHPYVPCLLKQAGGCVCWDGPVPPVEHRPGVGWLPGGPSVRSAKRRATPGGRAVAPDGGAPRPRADRRHALGPADGRLVKNAIIGLSFQVLGFKVLPRTAAKTSKLAAEIADGRPAKKAIIVLFVQELGFKVLPRTRLRRPRSSPRRSRMAAWPIGRSTACSSRSLSLRCCLEPGCEDFEAHRGVC